MTPINLNILKKLKNYWDRFNKSKKNLPENYNIKKII